MPQLIGTVHLYTGFVPSHMHRRTVVFSGVVRAGRVVREEERIGTIGSDERVEVFPVDRTGERHRVSTMPYYVWAYDLADPDDPSKSLLELDERDTIPVTRPSTRTKS
jgi:hypothetical protein